MLLEEMIHAYWRDASQLSSSIPIDRFYTGPAPIPSLPCVVLVHEKSDVMFRTNRKLPWSKSTIRFELHHESFEQGAELAGLIEQSFDRLKLEEPRKNWAVMFRFIRGENVRDEGRAWKFVRWFQLIG